VNDLIRGFPKMLDVWGRSWDWLVSLFRIAVSHGVSGSCTSHLQERNEFARFLNSGPSIRERSAAARRVCAIAAARASTSKNVERHQEVTRFPRSRLSKMHLHCDSRPQRCCISSTWRTIPFVVVSKGETSVTARAKRAQDIQLIINCNYRANLEARIISAAM